MLRRKKRFIVLAVAVTAVCLGYAYWRHLFPYGYSHCCLKALGLTLMQYAEEHDGRYPSGEACPEASLSLLYDKYVFSAETLRGKTVPVDVVRRILESGELLGPDTCGWHYVEGLTLCDDPHIALVWDKVGLGHNGQRLSGGGHSVWFLGGREAVISNADWPEFLQRQRTLMANRTEAAKKGIPALSARVHLPSGDIVDGYEAAFTLRTRYNDDPESVSGSLAGERLTPSNLRWYRLSSRRDGTMILTLQLNDWESQPVQVDVSDGIASPQTIIFEMASRHQETASGN